MGNFIHLLSSLLWSRISATLLRRCICRANYFFLGYKGLRSFKQIEICHNSVVSSTDAPESYLWRQSHKPFELESSKNFSSCVMTSSSQSRDRRPFCFLFILILNQNTKSIEHNHTHSRIHTSNWGTTLSQEGRNSVKAAQTRLCCDRKDREACAQSFALWQQATIAFTRRDHSIITCSRYIYVVFSLRTFRS